MLFNDDDLLEEDSDAGEACPSCGVIVYLDGPTDGCRDPDGCASEPRDLEDEDEDYDDDEEEEDDEDLDELFFDE